MARRGMGLDSVVRAKILTSGISLSFVLWWWSKQPSPAQPKKLVESGSLNAPLRRSRKSILEKREGLY